MSADPMRLPHNRIVATSDQSLVNTTTTVRSNVSVIDGVAHRNNPVGRTPARKRSPVIPTRPSPISRTDQRSSSADSVWLGYRSRSSMP